MSIENRISSTLRGNLSGGRQTSRLSGIYVLLQLLNTVSGFHPLYCYFNKAVRVERLFGLHNLKPSFNCFFNIGNCFFAGFTLGKTAGKGRDFDYEISGFILFYYDMQFHFGSLFISEDHTQNYHRYIFLSNVFLLKDKPRTLFTDEGRYR